MIRLTNLLLELLLEKLPSGVLQHRIPNPREKETGHADISIGWALKFPQNDPAHKAAKDYLLKFKDDNQPDKSPDKSTQQTAQPVSGQQPGAAKIAAATAASRMAASAANAINSLGDMMDRGSRINISISRGFWDDPVADLNNRDVLDAIRSPTQEMQDALDTTTYDNERTSGSSSRVNLSYSSLAATVSVLGNVLGDGGKIIEVSISSEDHSVGISIRDGNFSGRKITGQLVFDKDPKKSHVYADYVVMDVTSNSCAKCSKAKEKCTCSDAEKSGIRPKAPTILRTAIDAADAVGITKIKFTAGLEAGAYQWAKMGATPDSGQVSEYALSRRIFKIRELAKTDSSGFSAEERVQFMATNGFRMTDNSELDAKLSRKLLNDIETMKKQGEFDTAMQLLDICMSNISQDPTLVTVIANHDLGRYLLQGTSWSGKFDITPGSESRDLILRMLR